jgi:hypothetical protein
VQAVAKSRVEHKARLNWRGLFCDEVEVAAAIRAEFEFRERVDWVALPVRTTIRAAPIALTFRALVSLRIALMLRTSISIPSTALLIAIISLPTTIFR